MNSHIASNVFGLLLLLGSPFLQAQSAPTKSQIAHYENLHKAAHTGNTDAALSLIKAGASLEERDGAGRTPVIVATFASNDLMVELLAQAGANLDAFEHRSYDVVTIASVANDVEMLKLVLEKGASAKNITSPYDGTALIAAAHLGHHEVVELLIVTFRRVCANNSP